MLSFYPLHSNHLLRKNKRNASKNTPSLCENTSVKHGRTSKAKYRALAHFFLELAHQKSVRGESDYVNLDLIPLALWLHDPITGRSANTRIYFTDDRQTYEARRSWAKHILCSLVMIIRFFINFENTIICKNTQYKKV